MVSLSLTCILLRYTLKRDTVDSIAPPQKFKAPFFYDILCHRSHPSVKHHNSISSIIVLANSLLRGLTSTNHNFRSYILRADGSNCIYNNHLISSFNAKTNFFRHTLSNRFSSLKCLTLKLALAINSLAHYAKGTYSEPSSNTTLRLFSISCRSPAVLFTIGRN